MLIMNIRLPQLTKYKNIPAILTFGDKNNRFLLPENQENYCYEYMLMFKIGQKLL